MTGRTQKFVFILCTLAILGFPACIPAQVLLSLHKPVTGSAYFNGAFNDGEVFAFQNITDGLFNDSGSPNNWSFWMTPNGQTGFVTIDLQAVYLIQRLEVQNTHNRQFGDSGTKNYRLRLSNDNINFTLLVADQFSTWPALPLVSYNAFPPLMVRYVRFDVDSFYGQRGGINELSVYGSPINRGIIGRLALEGVSDLSAINPSVPLAPFHISLRTPGKTQEVFGADVTLVSNGAGSPFGTYSISDVPAGIYDVAIKGSKNLRVVIPNVALHGLVTLPDQTLRGGDANNDNMVDIADFGLLVGAYGSTVSAPTSGYDARADLTYDGSVEVADFSLLINEYSSLGAP